MFVLCYIWGLLTCGDAPLDIFSGPLVRGLENKLFPVPNNPIKALRNTRFDFGQDDRLY